jgi:serine/threonine-protein kinase HipA
MRRASILVHGEPAALLEEFERNRHYRLSYRSGYEGPPASLTLPVRPEPYEFEAFPAFLDGLLPEGMMLEGLLRQAKIDARDYLRQLIAVGGDMVGALTVERVDEESTP